MRGRRRYITRRRLPPSRGGPGRCPLHVGRESITIDAGSRAQQHCDGPQCPHGHKVGQRCPSVSRQSSGIPGERRPPAAAGRGGHRKRDKWSRYSLLRVPLHTLLSQLVIHVVAYRSSEYVARQSLCAGGGQSLLISRLKVRLLRAAPTPAFPSFAERVRIAELRLKATEARMDASVREDLRLSVEYLRDLSSGIYDVGRMR